MHVRLPMDVVLSVCRKVIVDNQGNLLHVNATSLTGGGRTQVVNRHGSLQTIRAASRRLSGLTNKSVVISTLLDPDRNSLMMISRSF